MKKRKIALLLCTALTVAMMAGCGNTGTEESKTASQGSVTEEKEASVPEGEADSGEVTVVTTNLGEDQKVYLEMFEKFNNGIGKENNVRIELVDMDNTAATVALENGTEPDIIFSVQNIAHYVEDGYIVSLEDYPEFDELLEKNDLRRVEGLNVYNGKLYTFPRAGNVYGLMYNKDMFKAAGLVDENGEATPPKTYEEMREYAKILTNPDKREYGIIYPTKWTSWYRQWIEIPATASSGVTVYDIRTGEYDFSMCKPLIEAILGMDDDGSVYPGADGMDNDVARTRFAEGNVGMIFSVSWDIAGLVDTAKCDWGVAPVPTASEDEVYYGIANPQWSAAISKRGVEEKGIEKIALAYNYIYSDEMMVELYKQVARIPWRNDIIEMAGKVDMHGLADYGAIRAQSKEIYTDAPTDIVGAGYDASNADFTNKVWSRRYTVDEWIAERNQIYNEEMKNYREAHPEVDYTPYEADPDYDRRYTGE